MVTNLWNVTVRIRIGKKYSNYSGIKLSIPLILSLSKDKADVKTGSWFDKWYTEPVECALHERIENIGTEYLSSYKNIYGTCGHNF